MYSLHRHTYLKYIYFCYKCKEYLFCCKRNQKSKYISAVLCKSHSPVTIPCLTVQKQCHLLHIAPWPLTTTPARDSVYISVCMFSSTFFFFFTSLNCSLTSVSILGEQRLFFYKPIILLGLSLVVILSVRLTLSGRIKAKMSCKEIIGMFTGSSGQS